MAGSFVAGVDDGSALYYNPAGLADIAGVTGLVDFGLVLQRVGYDRIDAGGNPQPRVNGSMDVLPIPTLAITWKPTDAPRWTIAGGVWTPYLGVDSWPADGPQRYSNVCCSMARCSRCWSSPRPIASMIGCRSGSASRT